MVIRGMAFVYTAREGIYSWLGLVRIRVWW